MRTALLQAGRSEDSERCEHAGWQVGRLQVTGYRLHASDPGCWTGKTAPPIYRLNSNECEGVDQQRGHGVKLHYSLCWAQEPTCPVPSFSGEGHILSICAVAKTRQPMHVVPFSRCDTRCRLAPASDFVATVVHPFLKEEATEASWVPEPCGGR